MGWGSRRVAGLGVGVKSNLIQYLIPILVGLWYDSGGVVVGRGVGSSVKPNPIPNYNTCRVAV